VLSAHQAPTDRDNRGQHFYFNSRNFSSFQTGFLWRQTDRKKQVDQWTGGQAENWKKLASRQAGRKEVRQTGRNRLAGTQTGRKTSRQKGSGVDEQECRQAGRQKGGQAGRQAGGKQEGRQIDR